MAQFVTHIQPTLMEAAQGHVPHHHGHQLGMQHDSHLPHSGHNMPSPPTHHNNHPHHHQHHHHQKHSQPKHHHHDIHGIHHVVCYNYLLIFFLLIITHMKVH